LSGHEDGAELDSIGYEVYPECMRTQRTTISSLLLTLTDLRGAVA